MDGGIAGYQVWPVDIIDEYTPCRRCGALGSDPYPD